MGRHSVKFDAERFQVRRDNLYQAVGPKFSPDNYQQIYSEWLKNRKFNEMMENYNSYFLHLGQCKWSQQNQTTCAVHAQRSTDLHVCN